MHMYMFMYMYITFAYMAHMQVLSVSCYMYVYLYALIVQSPGPILCIQLSLRYRVGDRHLRMLLHSVKPKTEGKANSHGSYFINMYLIPDDG